MPKLDLPTSVDLDTARVGISASFAVSSDRAGKLLTAVGATGVPAVARTRRIHNDGARAFVISEHIAVNPSASNGANVTSPAEDPRSVGCGVTLNIEMDLADPARLPETRDADADKVAAFWDWLATGDAVPAEVNALFVFDEDVEPIVALPLNTSLTAAFNRIPGVWLSQVERVDDREVQAYEVLLRRTEDHFTTAMVGHRRELRGERDLLTSALARSRQIASFAMTPHKATK